MGDSVEKPAMQVIVLGSGGGPVESNTTAFLVRSAAAGWKRGSVLAVDAGVHLAAIANILESHKVDCAGNGRPDIYVDGPFEGMELFHTSPKANAAYVTREMVETCLITHPHLDHISGFVVNTAALHATRPKKLAALPHTIDAFRAHIFNNVIWPNLSDENNGAGLVTYMRLVEGGSPALGDGDGKGYVEVCEGLSVKTWAVSHGHCIERHAHRGSSAGLDSGPSGLTDSSPRQNSAISPQMQRSSSGSSLQIPGGQLVRRDSHASSNETCVYDSSAYFIRDITTGKEILIFGDVEPDRLSLFPRNKQIWNEAAPKIVSGLLGGIFIECSFDDSQSDDTLFGHLKPYYLIQELQVLADEVFSAKNESSAKKRKRHGSIGGLDTSRRRPDRSPLLPDSPVSPFTRSTPARPVSVPQGLDAQTDGYVSNFDRIEEECVPLGHNGNPIPLRNGRSDYPLKGLKIFIIHIKDRLNDEQPVAEVISEQMKAYEQEYKLGCEIIISHPGQSVYF